MFNYSTYEKELDNLLWVYSPDASKGRYLDFYPGDSYVDIVGLDSYTRPPESIRDKGYITLLELGKPFGLTEFGPYHGINFEKSPRSDYDYFSFIQGVEEYLPACTFFLIWHNRHGLHYQSNGKECLEHPWVINLDDLPSFGR